MSKETSPTDKICGNCKWFDTKTVGGNIIGTIEIEPGKTINEGFCRAWPADY